jgi:hypothetical protein
MFSETTEPETKYFLNVSDHVHLPGSIDIVQSITVISQPSLLYTTYAFLLLYSSVYARTSHSSLS